MGSGVPQTGEGSHGDDDTDLSKWVMQRPSVLMTGGVQYCRGVRMTLTIQMQRHSVLMTGWDAILQRSKDCIDINFSLGNALETVLTGKMQLVIVGVALSISMVQLFIVHATIVV